MANEATPSGDIFDVKRVRRLVELMKEHDLAEVDLRQGEQRIRIRRGAEPLVTSAPSGYQTPSSAHAQRASRAVLDCVCLPCTRRR